jgi:hypothetical protein
MLHKNILLVFVITFLLASCGVFNYTFHSKKNRTAAKPGILFPDAVVEYRNKNHEWPKTLHQFKLSSAKNKKIADELMYNNVDFVAKDTNNLNIYLYDFKKSSSLEPNSKKIDLNALHAQIKIYKAGSRFVYKIK